MLRDKTIDRLRGLAMLWVIVVHVFYWGIFYSSNIVNLLKSFFLFEMPLFFFITGASNSFSKIKGYFDFVIKRYKRILIPYWAFAVICAILSIGKCGIEGELDFLLGIKIFLSWIVPVDKQITDVSYLNWATWFIPVYLCVVLVIPVLKQMRESTGKIAFGFLLLGIFAATCFFNLGWIQNVAFYSFWTYVGLFYSDIKSATEHNHTRRYFLYLAVAGMAVLYLLYRGGQPLNMQYNKFPPNMMFLVFSIVAMAAIAFVLPCLDKVLEWLENGKISGWIFKQFSTRSMTVFLYQVFAFNLTIHLTNMVIHSDDLRMFVEKSIFCFITTVLSCAVLAVVFGKIETFDIKRK